MKYNWKLSFAAALIFSLLFTVGCKREFTSQISPAAESSNMSKASKPNIILIIGDDIGYEIPAADGGRSYQTPNLDRLANTGMRFTQVRSAPLCSPSRFMLLTGKYNFRNYITWGIMDTTQRTIGNMLRDAGYATCYAGKWQLDGGDNSIRKLGFDKYRIWLPYKICPEELAGSRYKSADIYEGGNNLPDSVTDGKYSEDFFSDYVLNFIDSNKANPFFVYYSMILGHKPYSPTPEDPEFETWDSNPENSDTAFYPSMVKYMDKKIGMIMNKLNQLGIANNTIVIYTGDNGTQREIISKFNNTTIQGAKGQTVEYGIHVPLFCNWPGTIASGRVNGSLIDFTDFLPTLADIANIPVPSDYGVLDGLSFYPQLISTTGAVRNSIFTHFQSKNCNVRVDTLKRYAQDSAYKLYDAGPFIKFKTDVYEQSPLADSSLTRKQKTIKKKLQDVIDQMHN